MARRLDSFDFAQFFNAMNDEVVIVDADGVIIAANSAWKDFCVQNGGPDPSHYVGSNYFDICNAAVGDSSAEAAFVLRGFRKVLESGEKFRCEYPCDSPDIKRWFELTAFRLTDRGESFVVAVHRNITTRHVAAQDVEDSHVQASTLAALVATTSDAVLSYDLNGRIIVWNRAAEKMYGYRPEEVIGRSLEILYPPDAPHGLAYYRDEIIAGNLTDFEAVRIAKDGTERHVWIACAPIRSKDGEIVSISNIHRDITEIRRAEEARKTIAREVVHRAKNMLAVVNAIQRQTARSARTIEEFSRKFDDRVQSLAMSTDLLVSGNWTTVPLDGLLESQLAPFTGGKASIVSMDGPAVVLGPQAVQVIGMAIHELATNSAKYGALKDAAGEIRISWDFQGGPAGAGLDLRWAETGIRCDAASVQKGFGNTVLTSMANSMLKSEADFRLEPTAVTWRVVVPSEQCRRA